MAETPTKTAKPPRLTKPQQIAAFSAHLNEIGACFDAHLWATGRTSKEAWKDCTRADWLLWWQACTHPESKPDLVRVACQIARLVLHLVPDGEDRPRLAIEAAERCADNPTPENLEAVRSARLAADAAAAYAADAAAADAAAAAAYAADAAYDAAAAAYAAAAATAAYAAYAAAATRKTIHTKALAIIRKRFSCPWEPR